MCLVFRCSASAIMTAKKLHMKGSFNFSNTFMLKITRSKEHT
nr:unnamed protein product [Callosobruchus analis]